MSDIYNFSAGPAVLPKEVLQQVQSELVEWHIIDEFGMENRGSYNLKIYAANSVL